MNFVGPLKGRRGMGQRFTKCSKVSTRMRLV